jgi:ACS family hexuronate transporter-like MFS transporter
MAISRRLSWSVAVLATLAMSVSYADRQVLAAVATTVRSALGIDALHFGWLAGSFSAAYLVAAPLSGWVLDRVGARRGLAVSVTLWSLVAAAHALAPTFGVLVALRVLLGVTEAPSFPGVAQCIRRVLPRGDRSAAFALVFTGSSLGAAVAGPLAVWLDVRFGWQGAFVGTALLGAVWIPLWLSVTGIPSVRSSLAAPDQDRGSAVAAVSLASLLTDPAVIRAVVLVFASAPVFMFSLIWLPQYLELARGVPKASVGQYIWLPSVMADAGMLGFGLAASMREAQRGPEWRSHTALVALAALMCAALAFVPQASSARHAALLVGLASGGAGGIYTLNIGDMVARIHPSKVATATGITAGAQSLVYVVLNPLIGTWFDRTHSFDGVLVVLGVVATPGVVAWAAWPLQQREA